MNDVLRLSIIVREYKYVSCVPSSDLKIHCEGVVQTRLTKKHNKLASVRDKAKEKQLTSVILSYLI